jgi:hypothetical protein
MFANAQQDIIFLITSVIDIFAIVVIALSVLISILPFIKSSVKSSIMRPFIIKHDATNSEYENSQTVRRRTTTMTIRMAKENFIKGLLLALELESANAILRMGIFTSMLIGTITAGTTFNPNNFIFFVVVFSVRIAINQSLRRFNIQKKVH